MVGVNVGNVIILMYTKGVEVDMDKKYLKELVEKLEKIKELIDDIQNPKVYFDSDFNVMQEEVIANNKGQAEIANSFIEDMMEDIKEEFD